MSDLGRAADVVDIAFSSCQNHCMTASCSSYSSYRTCGNKQIPADFLCHALVSTCRRIRAHLNVPAGMLEPHATDKNDMRL